MKPGNRQKDNQRNFGKMIESAVVTTALIFVVQFAKADEITIPVGTQGDSSLVIPQRGQTQAEVETLYGEPNRSTQNVGVPPISTWHYDQFSVYFESDKVIHAVIRRQQG